VALIQVNLIAPGNRRGAWGLPSDWLIGLLAQNLVEQMGLSTKIDWQLVRMKTGKPLPAAETFAKVGLRPGEVLKLEPVRNELLKKLLDKLYEEAEGHVQDELWDRALQKMEELHEYAPQFPDPKGLRRLAEMGITPSAIPAAGVSWGLVLGAVAVAGVIAVGAAVTVVGGGGYLLWRASQQEVRPSVPTATEMPGGGVQPHTGDVQITLEWYSTADLDLHVVDPNGDEVWFQNSQVASGGELDVDANGPCFTATSSPLENVYWPWGGAPSGEYEVSVHYYSECSGEGAVDYQVIVRVDGEVLDTYSGVISPGEEVFITHFSRGR
jgi:hypothetical protein